jgi:hypothetical protein
MISVAAGLRPTRSAGVTVICARVITVTPATRRGRKQNSTLIMTGAHARRRALTFHP